MEWSRSRNGIVLSRLVRPFQFFKAPIALCVIMVIQADGTKKAMNHTIQLVSDPSVSLISFRFSRKVGRSIASKAKINPVARDSARYLL